MTEVFERGRTPVLLSSVVRESLLVVFAWVGGGTLVLILVVMAASSNSVWIAVLLRVRG